MDDVEEAAGGGMYVDSSDLELVNDGTDQLIGLRFSLNVPQGALVTEADIRFTVDEVTSNDTSLLIWAQASDDAPAFSATNSDVSARPSTEATATWRPAPWENIGDSLSAQTSSDLTHLIQEVVNRPGWQSGNHLVLVISGSGVRTAVAYDGDPANATLLNVDYSADTSNHAPTLLGSPSTGATVGLTYEFTPIGSDPDGDSLSYSITGLPAWASFDTTTGRLSGSPQSGDIGFHGNIIISVSDGELSSSLNPFGITVSETNHAPTISGNPSISIAELTPYSFVPAASDADGDNLFFNVTNLPNWAGFNPSSGELSGTPGYSDAGIFSDISISVSDGTVSSSLPPFSITVTNLNRSPVISGNPNPNVDEGEAYSFIPTTSDPDGDNLSFSVSNLPSWATFDTNSGTISGTPDFDSAGIYSNIVVNVSDGTDTASLLPFSISVDDINRAPVFGGQPTTDATVDTLYSFNPNAQDSDGDALTYTVSNKPVWTSFNTTSGELAGTPTAGDIGVYGNIVISVTDGIESVSLGSFSITVSDGQSGTSGNIFVDQQIGTNYCTDYSVALRSCGSGDKAAYQSISGAASAATAGDIIEIRGGNYSEQLAPQNSGSAGSPITFRGYNGENAVITGSSLSPAIDISDRSHLVLEGLEISNVNRWMHALNSHHNIIRNNIFSGANDSGGSSKTGIFFQEATYNRILDNVIDDSTQDNISLIKSDFNLISGNTITNAAHAIWVIKCGNKNVVRDNYFHNATQKIGEVYDCDDVGFNHEFFIHDATKYNVIERNVFAKTTTYYSTSGGNGIQYAGQNGIIRFNTFFDNNVGIGMQRYSSEAMYNKHNRVYHNTFHQNHCGGISTTNPNSPDYTDNQFINNILSDNVECGGTKPFQLVYRNALEGFVFDSNNLTSGTIPDDVIGEWQGSGNTLSSFETNYPTFFSNNMELDPLFTDAPNRDYSLSITSPMVDAGRFLTTTVSSGSGRVIQVSDAGFFHDSFGIEGLQGDNVQLEGSPVVLSIVAIDYANNTITVDQDTSWQAGQGISLEYNGSAPDIGAFERQ
ncbi:MAG: putative Ig domain-containing protein [Candidatus Thiodiazotropha sp. (ex Monitilora ramsayi)]|nr:putative Ig domain-containing protein [Candidatus Thiodiazotropha sp. (ex Monitilora ramsayi)]